MRTFLLFLLLALGAGAAQAQDLLTKRNGEEVAVKILEITPAEVKYRRTDNPDGPLISVWKTDVFMIRYANGTKDVFGTGTAPLRTPAPAPAAPGMAGAPGQPAPADAPIPVIQNVDPNDAMLGESIHLDGPRLGVTFLSPGIIDRVKREDIDLNPIITQFGWQFETRLFRLANGVSSVVELVPLVGGLEQGKFLPSLSALLGIRGPKGFEFGFGPNVTPLGAGVVIAVGTSIQSNGINFPINLAVVPSKDGVRLSLLFGFNARHR